MKKLLAIVLLASCASNEIKNSNNPEAIYNEGVRHLKDESYLEATEFFNEVRTRFPQSKFSIASELRMGDLEYDQENFTESAALYGVFVDLYPTNPEAPYARYRQALSFYKDCPSKIARDQSSARRAILAAKALMQRYPQAEQSKLATDIVLKSRLKLAQKEAYIAKFYEKRDAYRAALTRWENVQEYKDIAALKKGEFNGVELLERAQTRSKQLRAQIQKRTRKN